MKVIETFHEGALVLELRGDFDAFAAEPFQKLVEDLVADGCTDVQLDLRRVRFVSSRAIGTMLRLRRLLADLGGRFRVTHMSEQVGESLESLGVDHLIVA